MDEYEKYVCILSFPNDWSSVHDLLYSMHSVMSLPFIFLKILSIQLNPAEDTEVSYDMSSFKDETRGFLHFFYILQILYQILSVAHSVGAL